MRTAVKAAVVGTSALAISGAVLAAVNSGGGAAGGDPLANARAQLSAASSALKAAQSYLSQVPATVTATTTVTATATVTVTAIPTATPTPTPTPMPTPTSATSTAAATGCFAQPSACGYPDATTTGVQPGVTLTPSGSLTVTQDGAVVQNLLITGELDIQANNVTVRNVKIVATGGYHALFTGWTYTGIRIEHVEIDGRKLNPSVPGLVGGGFVATNLNIHGTGDAVDISDNATLEDSYIHDLWAVTGDHSDGVQSTGSANNLIEHNTIDARGSGINSAAILGSDLDPINGITLNNNLLAGGNYTLYAGKGSYSVTNLLITNNRFADGTAQYGPCSYSSGVTASGNVWDTTGTPVCNS